MQIKTVLDEFYTAKYGLRHRSKRTYRYILGRFADWCEAEGNGLEQIKPNVVHRYLSECTGFSSKTLRGHAIVIRGFLSWCSLEEDYRDVVSESTVRRIVLPRLQKRIMPIFTVEETNALLKACEKRANPTLRVRDKAIISLLLYCGLRLSELAYDAERPEEKTGLRVEEVFFEKSGSYLRATGKGDKEREIGLGKGALPILRKYITEYRAESDSPYVFLSTQGGPLTGEGVEHMLYRVGKLAGVKDVHPHKFRNTFACRYLLAAPDEIYTLSRLLGHTSVLITQHYVQAVQDMQLRSRSLDILDKLE